MTLRMYCVADTAPLMAWWRQWASEGGSDHA